ncbi:MAG: class I SAM-dependent methyltransferase [Tepidisphaeraceae bacterium]
MRRHYRAIPEYYDAEYESMEMLRRDVPFLIEHLPKKPVSILELMAGTGRVAIPLAQAGHQVTGVDFDNRMLVIARRKRDAVSIANARLRFVHQNALRLSLPQRFDWAVILFNSFLTFTALRDQDRVLQNARKHLKPGGNFWLDVFNPNLSMLAEKRSVDLTPKTFFVHSMGRTVSQLADIVRDTGTQSQVVTFRYKWFDARGRERRERRSFSMTYIMPRELRILLERNGFVIREIFGDYRGGPVTSDSPRLIAHCVRPR